MPVTAPSSPHTPTHTTISPEPLHALTTNNHARAAHHLAPLTWDTNLARDAQHWADHLASIGQMVHSTNGERPGEGENLFAGAGREFSLTDAVNSWLGEVGKYHGEKVGEGKFEEYGHYTQCMWHSTTHVGMAKAMGKNGWWYIVGRYSPPGNVTGQKPY